MPGQIMIFNIGAFIVSCVLVAGYYLYLRWRVRHEPGYMMRIVNAQVRTQWVETIMSSGKMEILAIQTLRNSEMASTAVLLIIDALNLLHQRLLIHCINSINYYETP